MGNKQGKKTIKENVLESEWRKVEWGDKANLVDKVKEFQPANENVKHVRIMLHGPIGAGKSSFINSVSSCLRGQMTHDALVDTGSNHSFTRKAETHKIRKGNAQTFYPFVFTDLMGLESEENDGILEDDIKLALKGHIKDGYTFNPLGPIKNTDPLYNPDPAPEDKVHVLVSVIPADKVKLTSQAVIDKIRHIRVTASELGVPQICIITKIDEISTEVKNDIKHVYKMKDVKEKMEEFSARSGIPKNCIFAVKNYDEEEDLVDNIDVLILRALKHMINLGEDFINNKLKA